MPKKAAGIIYKALNGAVANAENNFNLNGDNLVISKITVDGGPVLKRFRPRARGMAAHIRKKTSHITVVVSDGEVKPVKNDKKVEEVKAAKPKAAPKKAEKVEGAEE
jgi:ribosomal protein L22